MTAVEPVWLARLSIGARWKIPRPTVRTIRQPPSAVPSVIAAPQPTFAHSGTSNVCNLPAASNSAAITPIDFCPSLAP